MDITEFLNARLDEDQAALEQIEDHSEPWRGEWIIKAGTLYTYNGWCLAVIARDYPWNPRVLEHIAAHDPARVLADITAKRKRLALYIEAEKTLRAAIETVPPEEPENMHTYTRPRGRAMHDAGRFLAFEKSVKLDAMAYASHPDFDPAWRTDD